MLIAFFTLSFSFLVLQIFNQEMNMQFKSLFIIGVCVLLLNGITMAATQKYAVERVRMKNNKYTSDDLETDLTKSGWLVFFYIVYIIMSIYVYYKLLSNPISYWDVKDLLGYALIYILIDIILLAILYNIVKDFTTSILMLLYQEAKLLIICLVIVVVIFLLIMYISIVMIVTFVFLLWIFTDGTF